MAESYIYEIIKQVWVSETHHITVPLLLVQLHIQTDFSTGAAVNVPQKVIADSRTFFC